MTKAELAHEISVSTGIERTTVMAVVEGTMEAIKASVTAGEPVYLRGFGTFGVKHRAAKAAQNISKKVTIVISEHDIPCFKPCPEFKNSMK